MKNSFYGWYMKCQSETSTLAVIPAVYGNEKETGCSMQFLTKEGTWKAVYSGEHCHRSAGSLQIGESHFTKEGMKLDVQEEGVCIKGELFFGTLTPLHYDIMGPLAYVPFLECRHKIWSMDHPVEGSVSINGKVYSFPYARGYWEGDQGSSFPKEYLWTQCSFPGGSVMLSIADVPLAGLNLTGVAAVVWQRGKEYRLATYLGARIEAVKKGFIRIRQKDMELEVCLKEGKGRPLDAPDREGMGRTVWENIECRAFFCFRKGGRNLFAFETNRASFECENLLF